MKITLIYTSTTPELMELVEGEIKKNIGKDVELLSLENPGILSEVRKAGHVTTQAAAELICMYMEAVKQGADAILNVCSSVGEVADLMQDTARYLRVPIVRIDEEMCREAVRRGRKIAILATLPTTLQPTRNTVLRVADEMGKRVEIENVLIDGAFGLDRQQFCSLLVKEAEKVRGHADVILLAQASMAYAEGDIFRKTGVVTLSSPVFGARELKKALERKGYLQEGGAC